MKHWLLALAFICFGSSAQASWQGKLDLQSSVQPMILREVHDGQWLAGLAHPNLFHLDHNGNAILHVGVFSAWNAETGNSSFGPMAGVDLLGISKEVGVSIPGVLGYIGEAVNLPSLFKPAVYLTELLSLDAFVGYRPMHTNDVLGNWIYGAGATLRVPFGVKELQAGL